METKIGFFMIVAFILGALVVGFIGNKAINYRLDVSVAKQQKVYGSDFTVYIDNKLLESCSENDEDKICKYSCAPDGVCVFIPNKVVEKLEF